MNKAQAYCFNDKRSVQLKRWTYKKGQLTLQKECIRHKNDLYFIKRYEQW